ncbi:uncharacterized protein LOC134822709 [Bolinopsis microptera]|uniref:uncharacterized protein LOC134822709 n=1 Tax=Bolinopsis microptera TaxID=2820187 RepID=UPI0030791805
MARRKKRAAPAKGVKKEITPEQNRRKSIGAERLKFNQINVDREIERMTDELKAFGERLIQSNQEAHEEFTESVPKEIGNLTLKEFFEAGYMLDYGAPRSGKFVALGPLHYEIRDEDTEPQSTKKMAAPLQTTRQSTLPPAEHFSTPAPGAAQPPSNLFITPKVVPQPKRGYVVVYTENGSPYHLNLATMKARHPQTYEEPSTVTRSTRTTRATRAASKR